MFALALRGRVYPEVLGPAHVLRTSGDGFPKGEQTSPFGQGMLRGNEIPLPDGFRESRVSLIEMQRRHVAPDYKSD